MTSKTNDTTEESRGQVSTDRRDLLGTLRRMAITVTSRSFWQVIGVLLLDGKRETVDAEVFSGIGFYARPAPGANTEAIIGNVGGAQNPAILATRDEDTRKRVAVLDQDETAMYNTLAITKCTKTGHIEARSPGGTATRLPTFADFEAFRASFNTHTHTETGTVTGAPLISAAAPTGTTVFKAE